MVSSQGRMATWSNYWDWGQSSFVLGLPRDASSPGLVAPCSRGGRTGLQAGVGSSPLLCVCACVRVYVSEGVGQWQRKSVCR